MSSFENKVVALYNKKQYGLNVKAFQKFIGQKVDFNTFSIDLIQKKLTQFNIQGQIDEPTLRLLLRIVTVVQSKGAEAQKMSLQQIESVETHIVFKSKQTKKPLNKVQKQSNQEMSSPQLQSNVSVQLEKVEKFTQNIKEQQQEKIDHIQPQHAKEQKSLVKEQEKEPQAQIRQLSSIEQVDNSTEINLSQPVDVKGPEFLDMKESRDESSRVKITQYQKFSADYVNPVIKYTIVYENRKVLRRFSDFEKLINILRQNYEGSILPKLPPKQGIKAGINYFWGIDEQFLEERKVKLEEMLNRLLQKKFVNKDILLRKFLTDQSFEIEHHKQGYGSYIKSLTDIVFNAKQLKDFGVAYYNYFREKGNVKLDPAIESKFSQISQIIEVFTALNTYRKRININFDKRRQLIHNIGAKSRSPSDSSLDRLMDSIEQEIQDLNFQFENYKDLKSQQSWIFQLIRQKEGNGQKAIYELMEQKQKLDQRLHKIEENLRLSLDQFKLLKVKQMQQISGKIMSWRTNVHP